MKAYSNLKDQRMLRGKMATKASGVARCAGNFTLACFTFSTSVGQRQLVKVGPKQALGCLHQKLIKTEEVVRHTTKNQSGKNFPFLQSLSDTVSG